MKSLEDLKRIREEAKKKMAMRLDGEQKYRVVVGMATCGIAAGARPVLNALVRVKNTESQTKLTREQRKENILSAFALAKGMEGKIKGQAVILIDDVCTTSATLEECARVLKEAGAREVLALTALRE